jgi:GNAT superfamily N-acetyltransferase
MSALTIRSPAVPDIVDRRVVRPEPSAPQHRGWVLRRARAGEAGAIKALFWKLHAFNASLDPRFALADDWEAQLDPALAHALAGRDALCLIARERGTSQPCGFALAALHRDSGLWRHREWVEVEALYVEAAWRGRGLAAALLERACGWAARVGQPVVQLYVTARNERALSFYRREGFQQTQVILRRVIA